MVMVMVNNYIIHIIQFSVSTSDVTPVGTIFACVIICLAVFFYKNLTIEVLVVVLYTILDAIIMMNNNLK